MIYEVTAISLDPRTGAVNVTEHTDQQGRRVERINTETNMVFAACKSEWDVEDAYEAFWNRLNTSWESEFPADHDKVKVLSVRQLS